MSADVLAFTERALRAAEQADAGAVEVRPEAPYTTSTGVTLTRYAVWIGNPGFRCAWGGLGRCESIAAELRANPQRLAALIDQASGWKR